MAAERDARTPFEQAVAVQPAGPGRYRAVIDGAWDGPAAPNGGVLAAIMVRAAQAELGSQAPTPRTISAHFLEAPRHGPVVIGVEILRGGKRVAVCDVRMRDTDRLVAQMTLVCSAARPQETTLSPTPLEAPPPESVEVADIEGSTGGPPMFSRVEARPIFGSAMFAGSQEALTGGWLALRDDFAPLDAARLCALCDLWWPAIYGRLSSIAGAPTLQLTVYLRSTEPDVQGPVLARFETRHLQEGHIEERGELWSSDGQLLAQSQQLALLLVPA
jgi:acyl-coenzyme A thioesterase PaaI-like protein